MPKSKSLPQQIIRLQDWLQQQALPFWTTHGINPKNGAVYEQMTYEGQADLQAPQRIRVQARQILTFCVAQQQHWLTDAESMVNGIVRFMQQNARIDQTSKGYTQTLTPEGLIAQPKLDTYDFAFYFLACFHRYKTFKDIHALIEANELLIFMENHFKATNAGWLEGDYPADYRRQNPHMHLFEAFMTGYEITKDAKWLAKAGEIYGLFESFFFNPKEHVLHEYFDLHWSLNKGIKAKIIEPGHMYEWVWLLRWYQQLTATPVDKYCHALYGKAQQIGFDPDSQLIYDSVESDGTVISATKRCWPLTELIKASLAQAKHALPAEREKYETNAALGIELLFKYYIHPKINGSYIDQIDKHNQVLADHAPASTLYHFIVAGVEAVKYRLSRGEMMETRG